MSLIITAWKRRVLGEDLLLWCVSMLARIISKGKATRLCTTCVFRSTNTFAPYAPNSQYPSGKWRSDAQKRINEVPPILVKGSTAVCDGGGGGLGHPLQYIKLDTVDGQPQICKYCGLRYAKAPGHHHHH